MIKCPNEFISGDGLNAYFSAGMASAAATMFFSYRATPAFTNPLTGFATGDMSGAELAAGAAAAGAACCAAAAPPAINIATVTNKLARILISISFVPGLAKKHTPLPVSGKVPYLLRGQTRSLLEFESPSPLT